MSCNCNENNPYAGSILKLFLSPTASGFDAENDDWYAEIRLGSASGKKLLTLQKSDMHFINGEFVSFIDSTGMCGTLWVVVVAQVPDADIDGGLRREVAAKELTYVNKL